MKALDKTNQLIKDLTEELPPVKVLPSPYKRTIKLLIVFFSLFILTGLSSQYLHSDLSTEFIIESFLILFTFILSLLAALHQNIPGLEKSRWHLWPVYLFGAWVLLLLSTLWFGNEGFWGQTSNIHPTVHCPLTIFTLGSLGAFFTIREIRKGAVLNRTKLLFFILLSGFTFGALAPQFYCPFKEAEHIITMHLFPVVVLIGFIFLIFKDRFFIRKSE